MSATRLGTGCFAVASLLLLVVTLLLAALFAAAFGFWVGVAFFAIEGALILALAILAGRGG